MNALSIYVTTCRKVLQSEADDSAAWAEISRLLSHFREAVTCSACEKLLNDPTSSSDCHYFCKSCTTGEHSLAKIDCERCGEAGEFAENVQMHMVLQCYKNLCEYIISSGLYRKWCNLNGGTAFSLGELLQEGAEMWFDSGPSSSGVLQKNDRSGLLSIDKSPESNDEKGSTSFFTNGNGSLYSVSLTDSNATKIMIKRTNADSSESETSNVDIMENLKVNFKKRKESMSVELSKPSRPKKRGCRCGLATRNPGQLTCCGQRCLCYVDRKACNQCRCRGCRNPNKYLEKTGIIQPTERESSEVELSLENSFDSKCFS